MYFTYFNVFTLKRAKEWLSQICALPFCTYRFIFFCFFFFFFNYFFDGKLQKNSKDVSLSHMNEMRTTALMLD